MTGSFHEGLFTALLLSASLAAPDGVGDAAQRRVVEHLRGALERGERIEVTRLLDEVFTSAEDRSAVERLFGAFFALPLRVAQVADATGRPPSLAEIEEQLGLPIPGTADVLLRVMEADPRLPRFFQRERASGAIVALDVAAIRAHPRFGRAIDRTLTGWEGRELPELALPLSDGGPLHSSAAGPSCSTSGSAAARPVSAQRRCSRSWREGTSA